MFDMNDYRGKFMFNLFERSVVDVASDDVPVVRAPKKWLGGPVEMKILRAILFQVIHRGELGQIISSQQRTGRNASDPRIFGN